MGRALNLGSDGRRAELCLQPLAVCPPAVSVLSMSCPTKEPLLDLGFDLCFVNEHLSHH